MQYKLTSVLAAGALVAVSNGAPIVCWPSCRFDEALLLTKLQAQELGLGAPSGPTVGNPTSDTTWGKRDVVWDPAPPATGDKFDLGKPSTGIIWGKRDDEASKPKDIFTIGKPTTVVDWNKRAEPADVKEIGDASTVVTWS